MTAAELSKLIGMKASLSVPMSGSGPDVDLAVEIIDARDSYGRTDLLVSPVGDTENQAWVSADRVKVRDAS